MTKLICPACNQTEFDTDEPTERDVLNHLRNDHGKSITPSIEDEYRELQDEAWRKLRDERDMAIDNTFGWTTVDTTGEDSEEADSGDDSDESLLPLKYAVDLDNKFEGTVDDGYFNRERAEQRHLQLMEKLSAEAHERASDYGQLRQYGNHVPSLRYHENATTRRLAEEKMPELWKIAEETRAANKARQAEEEKEAEKEAKAKRNVARLNMDALAETVKKRMPKIPWVADLSTWSIRSFDLNLTSDDVIRRMRFDPEYINLNPDVPIPSLEFPPSMRTRCAPRYLDLSLRDVATIEDRYGRSESAEESDRSDSLSDPPEILRTPSFGLAGYEDGYEGDTEDESPKKSSAQDDEGEEDDEDDEEEDEEESDDEEEDYDDDEDEEEEDYDDDEDEEEFEEPDDENDDDYTED